MLELSLCCKVCKLPTGELWSIVGDKDIRNTVMAELGFHELDYSLRMGVLKWADFHKDYVGLRLKSEQVCTESTPWSIRNIVGLH